MQLYQRNKVIIYLSKISNYLLSNYIYMFRFWIKSKDCDGKRTSLKVICIDKKYIILAFVDFKFVLQL